MNKCNYLGNLPCKNNKIKKLSDMKYLRYLINGLLIVEYNTTDPELRDFKDSFTEMMIKKLFSSHNFDNYFLIRNVLVQFPEKLIKYLKDELIAMLSKNDNVVLQETEKLTNIYEFSFLNSRIKTDDGYKIIKRNINVSDIYQAIIELDKMINAFVARYVEQIIANQIDEDEIKILIDMLDNDNNQELFQSFEENFKGLKTCQIAIIEKLYSYHYQELNNRLRQKLKDKINRCSLHKERDNEYEIMSFIAKAITKNN